MTGARGTSRGVEHQVDVTGEDLVANGGLALWVLGDLDRDLALDAVAAQHLGGAAGGDDREAHERQALNREDEHALVVVGDGDEDGALGG